MLIKERFTRLAALGALALVTGACAYVVDGVRFLTQESYISGKETLIRVRTAAMLGYAIKYNNDMQNADGLAPVLSLLAARIKEDRDYLETQVESCEETLLVTNGVGLGLQEQIIAGLVCNLGPGKRPDQL